MPGSSKLPPVPRGHRSHCPVSCTLDILGDRWTLVVVRDLFFGCRRYGDFLARPEGISTNLLAERLKRLEDEGLVVASTYQLHPKRYEYQLTEKGRELGPILKAVAQWGKKHIAGTLTREEQLALAAGH